jgi:hypothetical protein
MMSQTRRIEMVIRLMLVLLALCGAVLLVGCGEDNGVTGSDEPAKPLPVTVSPVPDNPDQNPPQPTPAPKLVHAGTISLKANAEEWHVLDFFLNSGEKQIIVDYTLENRVRGTEVRLGPFPEIPRRVTFPVPIDRLHVNSVSTRKGALLWQEGNRLFEDWKTFIPGNPDAHGYQVGVGKLVIGGIFIISYSIWG